MWHKIKVYWACDMPTDLHKEKWKDFESKLNYRANIGFFMQALTNLLWLVFDQGRVKMSREYIESGKCDCNEELSLEVLPVVETVIVYMTILRLILIVVSYFRPGVCKYYLHLVMLYYACI